MGSGLTIYTDGACLGNPGRGGWAWALSKNSYASGGSGETTTNNRMEILAVVKALEAFPGTDLTIVSDSRYVVDCLRLKWYVAWRKNGWRNSARKPVSNRDLWERLLALTEGRTVTMKWVKGHAGSPMNNFVDGLARTAANGRH